jgi:glutamate-ammonia-ligase adenylyltransferase
MKNSVWTKAVRESADPQRAQHALTAFDAAGSKLLAAAGADQARILCWLFSGSPALTDWLVTHPERLAVLTPELLKQPRQAQGLRREVEGWLGPLVKNGDHAAALARLRQFKQQEMLRIATRDLAHLANQGEITRELSEVADICLAAVWRICRAQLSASLGQPYHQDAEGKWQPTASCVLGLGKLGGQELNYSSDVDVMFIYAEEGEVFRKAPRAGRSGPSVTGNHQYFNRLAEMFIAEVSRLTGDGALYRIDLRLRPEGDSGPLTRSLESCENYYAQWGQTWERMALIKARQVAGDEALASEFAEVIQPFRYPRSLGEGVLREIAVMKDRIENEVVKAGELNRNVKLGRGGIREIEFVAQALQLMHAGRLPFLQGAQTLPALEKLTQYGLLPRAEARPLVEAYDFFRDVEHRLQMDANLQTHTIPVAPAARHRLARLMGFDLPGAFEAARFDHARAVRRVYERLLQPESAPVVSALPAESTGAEPEWRRLLAGHSFRDPDRGVKLLNEFACGPGYVHVSNRTTMLARQLLEKFLSLCPPAGAISGVLPNPPSPEKTLSDPDRVLTRLDSFIAAYGARATLFEMWTSNPALFELMLLLFDRSEFLAEVAIRTPDLVDSLVLGEHLRQRKSADETLADLRHGRNDPDQHLWLRQYHQSELMRIGLRDILGLPDAGQNLSELSALADACLQYALEIVLRRQKQQGAPVTIIGLGKLGGAEINYGSDLDIVFVTDAKPAALPKLQRVAIDVMDLLSARTAQGLTFVTDARLRPDGDKGLLVNTLAACEVYYGRRARLWEIQALTRSRTVAGNPELGERFQQMARTLTDFRANTVKGGKGPAAFTPEWRQEIRAMRLRTEKERTPPGQGALAIKTGAGGLMDAEFLAQTFSLEHAWHEPNTLRALELARNRGVLPMKDAGPLVNAYRQLVRVEGILRRWSFEGETVLPTDPAAYQRVAVRCGFRTAEEFRASIAASRHDIRAAYENAIF